MRARWQLLAEATALLDTSLDYEAALGSVVRCVVPRMADYCVVALVNDDGSLRWGHSAHRRPDLEPVVEALQAFLPRPDTPNNPFAAALRTGDAQLLPVIDATYVAGFAFGDAHRALWQQLSPVSYMIVPFSVRGRVCGVLAFAATQDSGRHYTAQDLDFARRLGAQTALAVDHAVLHADAQRVARAQDELMAMVSHDLKNPLSTIQLAAQFLLEAIVPDDADHVVERTQLGAVLRASERMRRLIHDVLDVTRAEANPLHVSPVGCAAEVLVTDAVEAHRDLAAAQGIAIDGDVAPELPDVLADCDRVAQVFSNLIGNALKFTPAGGHVTVSAARATAGRAPDGDGTRQTVRFAVRDTGAGIGPEDQAHVFDRFWQVRATAQLGTGLGLAIVRSLVQAHSGEVGVESAPGTGSTFWFTLPAVPDAATPAR